MTKWMKAVCALLLFFTATELLGTGTRASLAQSQKETSQSGSPFVPGRILVQFRPEMLAVRGNNLIAESGARDAGEIAQTGVHILELPAGADEEALVKAFESDPGVEFAELDRLIPPAEMVPNDPLYGNFEAWNLPKISAPGAWSTTTGSSSVTVAILDTGVDGAHEDLAVKMVPGWNFYNNNSDTRDVYGHGTKVAGTASASSNNALGVASVAWGCKIMPIRISDANGNATYSAMASGLTWAADHGARVANISYIASNSSTVRSAASYFQSRGGVVTASAGNNTTFDSSSDNPYILTASATDQWDVLSYFSNTGNNIDVAAPEGAYTTRNGGGYTYAGGTSISAPTVAGVVALVLSANPSLTATQVQEIIKQSADDLGSAGWDPSYGSGRVNAARAVSLASGGGAPDTTPPTATLTSPAAGSTVSGSVLVQVAASDNVGVTSVNLGVDGVSVGNDAVAPYTFSWSTATVANGTHTLTVSSSDAAGNTATTSTTVTVSNFSDSTPPAVSITSPAAGARVSTNVSVYVSATDNTGVAKVELYVDGSLTASSTSAPFTTKWNARKAAAGAHIIQCKAYDASGNVGVSASVTVYK
jgi:thermitase